jgi:GT2 family glycosyltransferase
MKMINASIVLYKNDFSQIEKVINCFLGANNVYKLFLIDNSDNDKLKELVNLDTRIEYIFNNNNLGYGTAHNIGINKSIKDNIIYHIVLNPDLYFDSNVINKLYDYMEEDKTIGNIMPKVLYPNGDVQKLCKLLPTPLDWFGRFFLNYLKLDYLKYKNDLFEMKFANFENILNVPYLSGCFMFLRIDTLKKSGLFDENIFLHTEDTDLSRRIYKLSKNIYYPYVSIYHEHNREAYRNFKIMKLQIKSMFYYFNKWGWFIDKERTIINNEIINKYLKV